MHTYSLAGATLREAFRVGLLPGHPNIETPYAHLRTGQVRFNRNARPNTHTVLKALSRGNPLSRGQIAEDAKLSKNAVRHEVENLVREGRLQKVKVGNAYLYSLPDINTNPIRRSPHYWWKRCPVCETDRRLRRLPMGDYLHWCGTHYMKVISKEDMK